MAFLRLKWTGERLGYASTPKSAGERSIRAFDP
jgi:hypothetical protein